VKDDNGDDGDDDDDDMFEEVLLCSFQLPRPLPPPPQRLVQMNPLIVY
jgi:hypothetical protein